jgi:hypothetical protein
MARDLNSAWDLGSLRCKPIGYLPQFSTGAKGDKIGPGGLIGRVEYNGHRFAIHSTRTPIVMPKGQLFPGINDFIFRDNAGAFTVMIRVPKPASNPSRILIVSLGKEARFCQQSNEECWSKNRRGHFVITRK